MRDQTHARGLGGRIGVVAVLAALARAIGAATAHAEQRAFSVRYSTDQAGNIAAAPLASAGDASARAAARVTQAPTPEPRRSVPVTG